MASVSVSSAFPPVSQYGPVPPDIFIISSDQVYFSVHLWTLLAASCNNFDSYLSEESIGRWPTSSCDEPRSIILLDEQSAVIDLMLHAIYNLSYIDHSPSLAIALAAVNALKKYGVMLHTCIARGTLLHRLLLGFAPLHPPEMFAVAAENSLEDLAVDISPFLLTCPPEEIPDELVDRIGPLYLKRVFALHEKRLSNFRDIVAAPPPRHSPDERCTLADVQGVGRRWLIAIAQLIMEYRPGKLNGQHLGRSLMISLKFVDVSPFVVRSTLDPLREQVSCGACKHSLAVRVDEIVKDWSLAKVYTSNQCSFPRFS